MRKIVVLCCLVLLTFVTVGFVKSARINQESPGYPRGNAVETIAETEKWMKKMVRLGVKKALPYALYSVTEVRLNTSCLRGLMKLVRGIMNINDWAIRMVDAIGKPSPGILEGTATAMGDYDECLDIAVPKNMRSPPPAPYSEDELDFRGQFCVLQIHLPNGIIKSAMEYQAGNRSTSELANSKTFLRSLLKIAPRADVADYRFGICLPSTCNVNDLQAIVNEISRTIMVKATTMRCEVKESTILGTEHIIILSVIGIILLLVITGTLVEMILRLKQPQINIDMNYQQDILIQSALAFSAVNNLKKLFSLECSKMGKITSVRGMKFISVCLYVVIWLYATPSDFHFFKYRSAFHFYKFMEQWWFTVFANASAGIDTIFFIAGLQITYRLWKKNRNGYINVPKFMLIWYSRLTLSQLIVISLFMCLPLIGNGPIWADVVTPVIQNCKERWWLNILGLNNFWSSSVTCLPHTWLPCSLLHLLLLAPIILWILSKRKTVGIFVNIILILGSSLAVAMTTLMNELPPAPALYFLSFINIRAIWEKLFIQAYDHLAPFSMGMMLGYFINQYDKIELKKPTVCIGWCIAIACNLAVICGLYGYRHGEPMDMALSAVYASIHRIGWSLGIAWIVFACAYGYGGFVNSILSWKLFIPLDRVCTLQYILHPLIVFLHEGQLREKIYMGHLEQAMYATSYIVFTAAISALCYITCVAPFSFFEKKLWNHFSRNRNDDDPLEESKLKRKIIKPVTIDISFKMQDSKHVNNFNSRLEKQKEAQSFQT